MTYDYRLDKFYDEAEPKLNEDFINQLNSSGRYSEMNKIATGGMKAIYKAFDQKTQRYIAYATLNEEAEPSVKEHFIKEGRLTAKLNHPNIIPVYNMGLNEKQIPFFTMELKNGDSLNDIIQKLKDGKLGYTDKYRLRDLLGIFMKVCDAIDFAHSKKVLHLDIKPDNIQVGSYGEVIVCDWGLSKVFDEQTDTVDINQQFLKADRLNTATLHGYIKGTPGFMAPEQINGEKKSPQTDIFSLGCLLYALLSLNAPFKDKELKEVLKKTIEGKYAPLPEVPASIQAVIAKAMAVNAEDRYESVNTLKRDIESFLLGYATEAEDASSLKLLKLFLLRNKVLSFISSLSLLIIIIGTLTFINNIQEEKERAENNLLLFKEQKVETNKAQREYYAALIDRENKGFHLNFTETPLVSHQKTIRGLKELIEAYPQYSEAKSALGYHYFVGQEFKKSKEYLEKDPGMYSYLLPYLDKYIQLKAERKFLSTEDLQQLLNEIQPLKILHFKMLMLYCHQQTSKEKTVPLVKTLLQRLNPDWNSKGFNYDSEKQRMSIYGENFNTLGYLDFSPISVLKIKALSVKNTNISSIKPIKDLPIRSLEISNTKIPFSQIIKFDPKGLLRLVVNSKQYSSEELKQLPTVVEIKFSDIK